jgi:hypothetical protein
MWPCVAGPAGEEGTGRVLEDLPYVCTSRQMRITRELDVLLKANLTSANRVGLHLEEWRHEWVDQRQQSNLGRCWSLGLLAPNAAPGPAPADRPAESTAQTTLHRHGFRASEATEAVPKPVAAFLEQQAVDYTDAHFHFLLTTLGRGFWQFLCQMPSCAHTPACSF